MGSGESKVIEKYVDNPELIQQLAELRQQNAQLQAQINELLKRFEELNVESFEDLKRIDDKAAAALIRLASTVEGLPMKGQNFGFFGITSTGKSSIINKLIGKNVAEVGAGETTTQIAQYSGQNYNLYDIPGRNDEMSYFSMEYISFWKGLTGRFVIITSTVKEMTKVLTLLDKINLNYHIVVNKFDNVAPDERDKFKEGIRKEVKDIGLTGVQRIWFVSSKNPDQFPDWLDMVNYLTSF